MLILLIQSFYMKIIITIILEMLFQVKFDYLKKKNRDRAVYYNESTQTVIDNRLDNLSDDTVARIPKFKHIKTNIQNLRHKHSLPNIPQEKTFDRISDILAQTKRNDKFLEYDSGSGNDRFIIFSSHEQLQLLDNGEQLLVDGTFKVGIFSPLLESLS